MSPQDTSANSHSLPLLLDVEDFKGSFSFDNFFKSLVNEVLPQLYEDDGDLIEGQDNQDLPNGNQGRGNDMPSGLSKPTFAEAGTLLTLFKDTQRELVDLNSEIDSRLYNLKEEVGKQAARHQNKLSELEKGVQGLFESFGRLDTRISGVGQTAARIGDHLQSADAQRETAGQTIELIKYLMEFNSNIGDLMELPPLFSDDSRVAEAAAIAQKLRSLAEDMTGSGVADTAAKGAANASPGLEVAVANLQEYCNELENRLLAKFDAASHKRELSTMAECAKILDQFNRGARAMQRYVASRPMFIDVDIMNADAKVVLGEQGLQSDVNNMANGLGVLYKEIIDTVRKESAIIRAVFPLPDAVMSILVQRVLEQRVSTTLDRLLPKPSLTNPISLEEGGFLQYLRMLAAAYEKTQELAKDLRALGCGDLDVEGLAESLFSVHMEEYIEIEQASLNQLFQAKMSELKVGSQPLESASSGQRPSKIAGAMYSNSPMSVGIVTEFVNWNEEAVLRCSLFTPQQVSLAANVRAIFNCLLDEASQYSTEGLQRGHEALKEAANLRDRFAIGTTVSRRVAAAAASAAEAAATAGESSVRAFMVSVQRVTTNVAMVQQYFVDTIARLLLPVDGAHAACCEEMATAMSNAEGAALKGLQMCIDTIIAEVDRLLAAEQKIHDFLPPEDGNLPDYRPTTACIRVVAYLARMLEAVNTALEGLNKQAFMTELGNRLHKALLNHWQRFTFSPSGGLRLKRDVSEYADFVRNFKAPAVEEKFELLGTMVNVFIVAPESLPTLVDGSLRLARKDAKRFIQLREDYKKIANMVNSLIRE